MILPAVMIGHHAGMASTAAQTGWTWAQTAVLVAATIAIVGAVVTAVLTYGLNQQAARRERRARTFAEALSAVEDYAELPYRIRRRLADTDTRHQLTEEISKVQSRIAFYQAWMRIEAPQVAITYDGLVRTAKVQAGGQMKQAWTQPVRTKDPQMNLQAAYPRDQIDEQLTKCITVMRDALDGTTRRRRRGQ